MDELLTSQEAAARLKVAVNTLRDWRRLGKGPPFNRRGRFIRYSAAGIEAWIKGGGDAAAKEER